MFHSISRLDHLAEMKTVQRARGEARISVGATERGTALKSLYQCGCAKIRLPNIHDGPWVEAVFLNTSGGLTDGDHVSLSASVNANADLVLTSQACERVYRSRGDMATIENRIRIDDGANCAWLPQETILFEGGRIDRHLTVEMKGTARFLACESVVLGRLTSGETVNSGAFLDHWRVRRDGELVFADETALEGGIQRAIAGCGTMNGAEVFATVLYVGDDRDQFLGKIRELSMDGVSFGVSDTGKCLVMRLVAPDSRTLRRLITPLLTVLREGRTLPRVWSI